MEEQAALLPEGEQEAFRSAVQQIMKRLHKSINMGKTQEQPAVQREAPSAEGLLSPQEDMTQPPQEREAGPAPCSPSVKVRLQQLRKDRRPAPAVTQVEMAPPEPGRLPKASMTPDGCNGRFRSAPSQSQRPGGPNREKARSVEGGAMEQQELYRYYSTSGPWT